MAEAKLLEEPVPEIELPPTEDDLPCDDGMPMETQRHVLQMLLLIESLHLHWADRADGFVGGNMFLYYSLEQVKNRDFRGPDFFAVLGVPRRERKSWVVWQEGKGPDVVIELLSASTAAEDKGRKKLIYQDQIRVPEYFWYDPFSGELAGFFLQKGVYRPLEPDAEGRLVSGILDLALVRREGDYQGVVTTWLRFSGLDGVLLPTPQELAKEAEQQARQAEQHVRQAEQHVRQAEQQARQAERRAEQAENRVHQETEQRQALEERVRRLERELQRGRGERST